MFASPRIADLIAVTWSAYVDKTFKISLLAIGIFSWANGYTAPFTLSPVPRPGLCSIRLPSEKQPRLTDIQVHPSCSVDHLRQMLTSPNSLHMLHLKVTSP